MQFINNKNLSYILCTLVILLSGCSTLREKTPLTQPAVQSQALLTNYWTLKSKVGITTPQNSGSAHLLWKQIGNRYKIALTGPLGKSLGYLESDGHVITLKSQDGKVQTAETEDQLALALIGKPLPIAQLQFWIKGMKAPFFPIEPVAASPEHLEFVQKGWRVQMKGFQVIDGYKLPKKLMLTYPAFSEGFEAIQLKVIMKEWTLPIETAFETL